MEASIYLVGKNNDFVVYNDSRSLSDDDLIIEQIELRHNEIITKIRSQVWSCNCRFFFIICDDGILFGSIYSNIGFKSNLTWKIFESYLDAGKFIKNQKNKDK